MKHYATIIEHCTHYNENGSTYHTDEIILGVKDSNILYIKKLIADAVERTTEYKENKNAEIIINGNSEMGFTVDILNFTITTDVENILAFLN